MVVLTNKWTPPRNSGGILSVSTRFSLSMEMNRLTRDGTDEPSRETRFSGANGDRATIIFPVQLTTSRIGNLTRLILTLAICDAHTYIPTHTHNASHQGFSLQQTTINRSYIRGGEQMRVA